MADKTGTPPKDTLASDAWAGLAAMLVALPQALAFGVAIFTPLGPEYAAQGALAGFIGAFALGVVATIAGGAPLVVSAPCAPAAAVMGGLAAVLVATHGPEATALLLIVTALLAGGLQLLYGGLGGGRLIKFIPYPVVTGYLSSVAVLIFLSQAPKLLVLPEHVGLWEGLCSPGHWNAAGLAVGATAMTGMALSSRFVKKVPGPVIGLGAGVAVYWLASLFVPELRSLDANAVVVGRLPEAEGGFFSALAGRWSALRGLDLGALKSLLIPAATLSVLLSIDTLKTCVAVDALTRTRHQSDRELMGQGLGNAVCALLGGAAGAGTIGPTLVNVNSGAKTRLSGVLAGVFALAVLVLAKGLVAWIPVPALAGILLAVAWRMFDRKSLRLLRQSSTMFDFAVSATVIATAVTAGLMAAAGAGLGLAIILFIRDLMAGRVIRRKLPGERISSRQRRLPAEREALRSLNSQIVICELQGSLFFGTTDQLFTELEPDLQDRRFVVLDMRHVQSVDFTAAHMLKQIEDRLHAKDGRLILCNLPRNLPTGKDLESYFLEVGLVKPKRYVSIFGELDQAMEWVEDRLLEENGLLQAHSPVALDLREIDVTRELDDKTLGALRSILKEADFEPGEKVFSRGDEGDEVYLIRKGQIRINLPLAGARNHHIATLGRSDFFGEVAFLDRGKRTADAVAMTPTQVFVLSRARFNELSLEKPGVGAMLFARLARALALRLRGTDEELQALQEA